MDFLRKLFKPKQEQKPEEPLVLVFIPALVAILKAQEDKKGAPLEEAEVLSIRDNATCMAMSYSEATKMDEARGYPDIVAENAWEEWSRVRSEI